MGSHRLVPSANCEGVGTARRQSTPTRFQPNSHHPHPKRLKRVRFAPPTPNDLNGLISLRLQKCIGGHLLTLSVTCSRFEVAVLDPDMRGLLPVVDAAAGIVSVVNFVRCGRSQFPS